VPPPTGEALPGPSAPGRGPKAPRLRPTADPCRLGLSPAVTDRRSRPAGGAARTTWIAHSPPAPAVPRGGQTPRPLLTAPTAPATWDLLPAAPVVLPPSWGGSPTS